MAGLSSLSSPFVLALSTPDRKGEEFCLALQLHLQLASRLEGEGAKSSSNHKNTALFQREQRGLVMEKALQVKVLAAKADDLSSLSRSTWWSVLLRVFLTFTMEPHSCTHI